MRYSVVLSDSDIDKLAYLSRKWEYHPSDNYSAIIHRLICNVYDDEMSDAREMMETHEMLANGIVPPFMLTDLD